MTIQFDEDKQKQRLATLRKKEEEDVARALAEKYDIEYINLMLVPINNDPLPLIN